MVGRGSVWFAGGRVLVQIKKVFWLPEAHPGCSTKSWCLKENTHHRCFRDSGAKYCACKKDPQISIALEVLE